MFLTGTFSSRTIYTAHPNTTPEEKLLDQNMQAIEEGELERDFHCGTDPEEDEKEGEAKIKLHFYGLPRPMTSCNMLATGAVPCLRADYSLITCIKMLPPHRVAESIIFVAAISAPAFTISFLT